MPDIVTLTTDDQLREAMAVHETVHGDPAPVWEEFLVHHPRWAADGAHRAVTVDGGIVALTTLAMWEHRFGTTVLPAGEIGLVGTLPDHRYKGYSRALMESWLETMRADRVPLSFLIGIPGFYEQWDYHYAAPDHVNAFLSITHDPLERCAAMSGTVRSADPDRDAAAIVALIDQESRQIPGSPVLDESLIRYFVDRSDAHGVDWRVVEDASGQIVAVVRMKRWGEGIGPQAQGVVTAVAARDDRARAAVAAILLDHMRQANQAEVELSIAPHGPFARWLYQRGARRKSDRSIFPGGYAAMYRINDLVAVLEVLRGSWDERHLVNDFAGTALTIRVGRDDTQLATICVTNDRVEIQDDVSGSLVDAPPAVTVPWVAGWRSAADWLDATPFPPLPGPSFDPGLPQDLPHDIQQLLRALFPARHPYIGDTTQGA